MPPLLIPPHTPLIPLTPSSPSIHFPTGVLPDRHRVIALAPPVALIRAAAVVVEDKSIRSEAGLEVRRGDVGVGLVEPAAVRVVVAVLVELRAVGVVDAQPPGSRGMRE